MQYYEAFDAAGKMGKGQYVVISMTLAQNLFCGWQSVLAVFVAFDVDFKCADNETDTVAWVYEDSDSYNSKCVDGCNKYVYKDNPSSIVTDWDLACGLNKVLGSMSNSAFWVGFLISCFVTGYAGDRFGRRPTNLCCMAFYFIFSFASMFSFDIWFYMVMRFFCGFCHGGYIAMAFLLMAEIIDKKYLAELSMGAQVFFAFGEIFAAGVGYIFKSSWRYQLMTVSLVLVPVFILNIVLVPESPLWLHSKGRIHEAQKILRHVARLNKKDPSVIVLNDEPSPEKSAKCSRVSSNSSVSDDDDVNASDHQNLIASEHGSSESELTVSIVDLFRTTPAVMVSLGQISAWFAISLVFYGLIFGVGNIGGDEYLNSALLAAVEIPVWFMCFAMNYFGRKPVFLCCLIISSVACAILPFTKPLADGNVQIVFALISKCMAAGGFNLLYTYSPELYPTVLRGTGLLLCSAAARVAVIIAPFVTDLDYGPYDCTPYIIFASSGAFASVFVIFYGPETLNKPLSNTIKDFYEFCGGSTISVEVSDESQHGIE